MADTQISLNSGQFADNQSAGQIIASASGCGALRVSQTEPAGLELSRAGLRFAIGQSAAITGIAPVQDVPTTAAQWTIWNASTTKSLVFEQLGAYLEGGVAGVGTKVVVAHFAAPASVATRTGLTLVSMSNSSATSSAFVNVSVTVTSPAAPGWFFIASDNSANTAIVNVAAQNDFVDGKIIVPPLRGLALAVLSLTGTSPLFVPMAQWIEKDLDLE